MLFNASFFPLPEQYIAKLSKETIFLFFSNDNFYATTHYVHFPRLYAMITNHKDVKKDTSVYGIRIDYGQYTIGEEWIDDVADYMNNHHTWNRNCPTWMHDMYAWLDKEE